MRFLVEYPGRGGGIYPGGQRGFTRVGGGGLDLPKNTNSDKAKKLCRGHVVDINIAWVKNDNLKSCSFRVLNS